MHIKKNINLAINRNDKRTVDTINKNTFNKIEKGIQTINSSIFYMLFKDISTLIQIKFFLFQILVVKFMNEYKGNN